MTCQRVWLEIIVAALAFCSNLCNRTTGHWFMSQSSAANHLLMEHGGEQRVAQQERGEGSVGFGIDVK